MEKKLWFLNRNYLQKIFITMYSIPYTRVKSIFWGQCKNIRTSERYYFGILSNYIQQNSKIPSSNEFIPSNTDTKLIDQKISSKSGDLKDQKDVLKDQKDVLKYQKNVRVVIDKLKLIASEIVYPKDFLHEKGAVIWNPWDHKYQTQSNS